MKYLVEVAGIVPEPIKFTVIDNVWWVSILGAGGLTLSKDCVRLRRDLKTALLRNPKLLVHEATHVLQARKLGAAYLPTYSVQLVKAGFDKHKVPMEIEAYANESKGSFIYKPL